MFLATKNTKITKESECARGFEDYVVHDFHLLGERVEHLRKIQICLFLKLCALCVLCGKIKYVQAYHLRFLG